MSALEIPSSSGLVGLYYKSLSEPRFIQTNYESEEEEFFKETLKENLEILGKITLPDWFDMNDMKEYLAARITKELKENLIFQSQQKVYKYTRKLNEYLKEYFAQIYDHQDNVMRDLQNRILSISGDFLNSDLPPSFLRILSLSFKTEQRFEAIYKKKIRSEEVMLRLNFNNSRKFGRVVEEHNAWVERVNPFLDDMMDHSIALLWYVDIWNSRTWDELFERKIYRVSALDEETLEKMLAQLESMIKEVRRRLINLDKEEFLKVVDIRDSTVSLLTNSVLALDELSP